MGNEKLNTETYRKIKEYALAQMANVGDESHNDKHVLRVKKNAVKITKLLNIENKVDINLLKAICLLHDFTYTVRKPSLYTYFFEGHIERKIIRLTLEKFNLSETVKNLIISAAFHHTHSFPFRRLNKKHDVYTQVLQDADTLDFFDCLRIKMYFSKHNKGPFKKIRQYLSQKLIEYGQNNLGSFLNYPILAKTFFLDKPLTCISTTYVQENN